MVAAASAGFPVVPPQRLGRASIESSPQEFAMPYVEASVRRRQIVVAARRVMERAGVGGTSMRDVAAEAGVPLGTLQHVFPVKEQLLRAVFEDVVEEMTPPGALGGAAVGLAATIRLALDRFWAELVQGRAESQVMQHELLAYAVRASGEGLAPWLYQRYVAVATDLLRGAADGSGERCAVSFERLGRLMVAGLDGILLQYLCDPDDGRAREDLAALAGMLVHLAAVEAPA